jgi:hypothetical protein
VFVTFHLFRALGLAGREYFVNPKQGCNFSTNDIHDTAVWLTGRSKQWK